MLVSLALVQRGAGLFRDVVLFYAVRDPDLIRAALWPEVCAFADQNGYYGIVGGGGIDPIGQVLVQARREAGPFSIRAVMLVGFGGGCRAVREQIREGARPDVVVALDGVSGPPGGPIPPDEYYLGPWRVVADRARRGECLAVMTHTAQDYMESLTPSHRYPAPITVLREVTGFSLPALAPGERPVQTRDGQLIVESYPSRSLDRAAHTAQRAEVLPHVMHEIARPWLEEMDFTPTSLPRWQV